MNLGKALKQLRIDKGIKQKDLCESANITATYLSQIENNKKEPKLAILETLSKFLETPLPIIFFMALEEDDIPSHKKEVFKQFHPSVNVLVKEFF